MIDRRALLRGAMTTGVASTFLVTPRYSLVAGSARTRSAHHRPPLAETFDISPGVRPGNGFVRSAEEAAARAVALAEEAGKQGTFAVGGLLVDDSGRIVAEATNAVVRDNRLSDPTAHVERQLIDWVFRERSRGQPTEGCHNLRCRAAPGSPEALARGER